MADGSQSVVAISEYTSALRRWMALIAVFVVGGLLLGGLAVQRKTSTFESEALVQVRPIVRQSDEPNLDTNRQINIETEVEIAGSQRVAERALALRQAQIELGATALDDPQVIGAARSAEVDPAEARAARQNIEVEVVNGSDTISFLALTEIGETARDLAQSTAIAYLDFRRQQATAETEELRQRLSQRVELLEAELSDLANSITLVQGGGDPAAQPSPESEAQTRALSYLSVTRVEELAAIGSKMANLGSLTVDPGVLLTDAAVAENPTGLPFLAGPLTGGLLGLIVGLTVVLFIDRSDDRLRLGRGQTNSFGAPTLGVVATYRGKGDGNRLYPTNTAKGDMYRRLQRTVVFSLDAENRSVVQVAGVENANAGTNVAANLAAMAARAGRRTLLVAADLRNANACSHLGVHNTVGLSDVVLHGAELARAIAPVAGFDKLFALPPGNDLSHPADVVNSSRFAMVITAAQADYDLVVIETPPVLKVADAVDIAPVSRGAILVAREGADSRSDIVESVNQLHRVGADVIGVVLAQD